MKFTFEDKPKKGKLVLVPENEIDVYEIGRFVGKANISYELSISNTKKKINHLCFAVDKLWMWMKASTNASN